MSKPIIDELRAREIEGLVKQMYQPFFELEPAWSEDEYTIISTIWNIQNQPRH